MSQRIIEFLIILWRKAVNYTVITPLQRSSFYAPSKLEAGLTGDRSSQPNKTCGRLTEASFFSLGIDWLFEVLLEGANPGFLLVPVSIQSIAAACAAT